MNLISMIPSRLFWDVDVESLDPEKNKHYIIPRIMDRGDLEEVRLIMSYYGKQVIKDVLLEAPYLDIKTISFFANYFNCSRDDFRAYRRKGLNPWT